MQIPLMIGVRSEAEFDASRKYRFVLKRIWDESRPRCCFIMLNPSTADCDSDDPTVHGCQVYCRNWGMGSLIVVNLFAFRTPSPEALKNFRGDVVGRPWNDVMIAAAVAESDLTIAAWGTHGKYQDRAREVLAMLRPHKLHCIDRSKDGHPVHPLYQKRNRLPLEFS